MAYVSNLRSGGQARRNRGSEGADDGECGVREPFTLTGQSAPGGCVIFCATARTGSTMVFDDFRNVLGHEPVDSEILYEEIIHRRTTQSWAQLWPALQHDWTVGPYWCVKVMYHYTPYISRFIAGQTLTKTPPVRAFSPADCDDFQRFFKDAVWVHVRRRDVYAQAVSMYFAETTGVWESREAGAARVVTPAYDRDRILEYLKGFIAERRQWDLFFSHYNIAPLNIDYEDAIGGYPRYLEPLLQRLGLRPARPVPPRRLFKIGDEINTGFAERLRADALALAVDGAQE